MEAAGATPSAAGVGGDLNGAQFLQLLVAQMKNQDPLQPQDNSQFIAELAQFTTLQTEQANGQIQGHLLNETSSLRAESLVGHTVTYTADGKQETGTVAGQSIAGSTIELLLDSGATVDLESVDSSN
jgi:flagellar basal-body rod modification protein FlgD